jgi:hypothetical protein
MPQSASSSQDSRNNLNFYRSGSMPANDYFTSNNNMNSNEVEELYYKSARDYKGTQKNCQTGLANYNSTKQVGTLEEFNLKKNELNASTNGQISQPVLSPRTSRPKTQADSMRNKKKVIQEQCFKMTSNPNSLMNSNKLYTNMLLRRSALHNNNEKKLISEMLTVEAENRGETIETAKAEESVNMPISRSFEFKKGSLQKLAKGDSRNHG